MRSLRVTIVFCAAVALLLLSSRARAGSPVVGSGLRDRTEPDLRSSDSLQLILWDPELVANTTLFVQKLVAHGISTVHFNYQSVRAQSSGYSESAAAALVADLHSAGIDAYALGGDPLWIEPEFHTFARNYFLEALGSSIGFDGVAIDIEPAAARSFAYDADYVTIRDLIAADAAPHTALAFERVSAAIDAGYDTPQNLDNNTVIAIMSYRDSGSEILTFSAAMRTLLEANAIPFVIGIETQPESAGLGVFSHVTFGPSTIGGLDDQFSAIPDAITSVIGGISTSQSELFEGFFIHAGTWNTKASFVPGAEAVLDTVWLAEA